MELWQTILLGVVQGLGEFLPISSSGHLIVFPKLLGFSSEGLVFDVALHFGTLLALIAFFHRDWIRLIRSGLRSLGKKPRDFDLDARLFWLIALGTIPIVVVGLLGKHAIEQFRDNPYLIASTLAGFGLLLFAADRWCRSGRGLGEIGLREAVLIGLSQCLALIPGVSRSGITITAARMQGLDRGSAARFSFLLSMPAVLGANVLEFPEFLRLQWSGAMVAGVITSAVVGYLAIKYMLYFLQRYSLAVYTVYRLLLAGLIVLVLW